MAAASSLLGCWIQYDIFSADILNSARGQEIGLEIHEIPPRKMPFLCEGYQRVDQVSLRGDGVSISGDTQKPTGNGPGLPVLDVHA